MTPPPSRKTPGPTYDRKVLVDVLVYHQRKNAQSCHCGWGTLGASHADHIADVYEASVTGVIDREARP